MKNLNFVKKFPIFGAIAVVFCIVGLLSVALLPFGINWFNLDIDFVGGTTLQYNLHKTLDKAELDTIAATVEGITGTPVSSIQKSGETSEEVVIKTKTLDTATRDKVFASLQSTYNLQETDILSVDNVDPVMGADIRDAAILSALLAVLLMLVYIAIRFDFKSGVAAVIALVHDLLVMLSFYVILQIPLNMNFIAAALTILGYSINATIVIFDRIRENRKMLRKATFGEIVNTSVHQTLTRSINTTITTLITIVLVAVLGVASIRNFAIPICIGIVAGLFSSVCISGPIWSRLMGSEKKQ
ncbi:MAG: protein translocase subunit SecF [Clostridia bacterium]|nr:protein translocase subunit SecF [Clostridia bacterium]